MNRLLIAVGVIGLTGFIHSGLALAQEAGPGCPEVPREDALPFLCVPPTSELEEANAPAVQISLDVPAGTPLRIALDRRTRVRNVGETVHGKVVEPVYAFDEVVIPAGSDASGRVTRVDPVSIKLRALAYSGGNFTPFHKYQVTFDQLTLPNGKTINVKTTTSPGTAEVVHLVANKSKQAEEKKKNVAVRAAQDARQEGAAKIHNGLEQIKSPNLIQRLKTMLYAQSPVHRQYIERETRFNATLENSLAFGETTRTQRELEGLGSAPEPDSLLQARLVARVSSADAKRGAAVEAILTSPLFSMDRRLLLPANTKLTGDVQEATAARNLHRNGELRIAFNRIELPSGAMQAMQGTLEGMEIDRSAHLALDEEGGARATTPKARYLSTAFSLLMLAAASRPDVEHGTTDAAGDPSVRAGAGVSGSRIAGSLISLAAHSQPISMAFGALGASQSIYSNFLSRGKDVTLPENTPLEIGFAPVRQDGRKSAPAKP